MTRWEKCMMINSFIPQWARLLLCGVTWWNIWQWCMNSALWKQTNQQFWSSAWQRCWVLCNLQVLQPSLLFSVTLLCCHFSPNLIGCRRSSHSKSRRGPVHLLGVKFTVIIFGCCCSYQNSVTPWPRGSAMSSLHHFISLLNYSVCLLLFSSPLAIACLLHPPHPLTRLALRPFLLPLSSISIQEQSCSLFSHQNRCSVSLAHYRFLLPPSSSFIWGTTMRQRQQSQCPLK